LGAQRSLAVGLQFLVQHVEIDAVRRPVRIHVVGVGRVLVREECRQEPAVFECLQEQPAAEGYAPPVT
jgi:hypothetical protein